MRYYLIVGEASGDLHGSNLIKGLAAEDPQAQFRFHGGDMMLAACPEGRGELAHHYKEGAVMGMTDVLAKAGSLLGKLRECKRDILEWKPDVVILIDYPGFNFKIAEFAHKKGLKVFYYIAPKTWASREGRNRKLKNYVDKLFIVFPFEKSYFDSKGISYVYKGNPLLDAVDSHVFSPVGEGRHIAILAGSRKGEISRTLPECMKLADLHPELEFIVAGAPSRSAEDYEALIEGRPNVRLVFGRTYDILGGADAAIINSGTASLEAALIGTPQMVVFSTSPLTAFLARKVLRVFDHIKYISLGNLIADKLVFKEFIQEDFRCSTLESELALLLGDSAYRQKMLDGYKEIRQSLGGTGASRAVAAAMIQELQK